MTVILGLLAYAALVYLALVLVGANDRAVPDVPLTQPEPAMPHCDACATADDVTLTSFDLMLWAIEHEGVS